MVTKQFSFKKEERLCSRTVTQALFANGKSFVKYPFRVVYLKTNEAGSYPAQTLISVSKKRHKRANKRNLLKRRIREAYRLNKHLIYPLLEQQNQTIAIALIYLSKDVMTFSEIEKGMIKVFEKLQHQLSKKEVNNDTNTPTKTS